MYALRDKEHTGGFGLLSYHLTREDAEQAQTGHVKHTRERGARVGTDGIPGIEWTEIVEIERESRPCVYCGEESQADDPKINYCRGCYYGGREHEAQRAPLIDALRLLDCVESADVWHTGGGCFLLAITLTDGRLITTTAGYADEETGLPTCDAVLPELGEPWYVFISASVEAFEEYREEEIEEDLCLYNDAELVARVRELGIPS